MKSLSLRLAIALAALLAWSAAMPCAAQTYQSDLLQSMAQVMGIDAALAERGDGAHEFADKHGRKVIARISDGQVANIGYAIFQPDARAMVGPEYCDFVERYLLAANLPLERPTDAEMQMQQDHVTFLAGGMGSIDKLQADTCLAIGAAVNEQGVVLTWSKEEKPVCVLAFPIDYELLTGRNMLENERRFASELLSAEVDTASVEAIDISLLDVNEDGVHVQHKGNYLIAECTADRYFDADGKPVFDASMPFYSLANLLTGADIPEAEAIPIVINHMMYGRGSEEIATNVRQFMAWAIGHGCLPHVGFISATDGNKSVDLLLVLRNARMGFNHVMRITADTAWLVPGAADAKPLTGRLHTYVPTSNIKNLFKEEE